MNIKFCNQEHKLQFTNANLKHPEIQNLEFQNRAVNHAIVNSVVNHTTINHAVNHARTARIMILVVRLAIGACFATH